MSNTERLDRYIIDGFRHIPGYHCGSTALRNLAQFYRHDLSEPMCFGLGAGIGFFYVNGDELGLNVSPSRLFGGRVSTLEANFFENLSMPFEWRESEAFPWPDMRRWIDHDVPILLLCDLAYLDYYDTSTHFSGHVVVLAGYDGENALISDTDFETLQSTTLDSLATAMVSDHFPMAVRNVWHEVPRFDPPDLARAGRQALATAARNMLEPEMTFGGIAGLRAMAGDLPRWDAADDLSWCARFAYQVIAKRGTGGANFRRLYAGFLDEIAAYVPEVNEIDGGRRMASIADQWVELAGVFKTISESEGVALLEEAAGITTCIVDAEGVLFRDLRSQVAR